MSVFYAVHSGRKVHCRAAIASMMALLATAVELDHADFDGLCQLCADFWPIWNAPTPTNRDRKEIIRTMIKAVIVEGRTEEEVRIRITWIDEAPDTPLVVALHAHTFALITALSAQGKKPEQIAEHLHALGLRTLKGRKWTKKNVAQFPVAPAPPAPARWRSP